VYGRAPGAEAVYWRVTAAEFVDTGAAGTSEAVPMTGGTLWSVKNIFELKNARNVLVENNIFENHWKESQPGFAIVLTPRNSNGGCTWCVVENVRFAGNIVRDVAAGINLLGYDVAARPTRQSANITFEQNLFTGMTTALGGNGWFLQIGDAPRNVTIAHNTIDSNGNAVVYTYGGNVADPREIYGFQMIANAARHGSYGINGQYFTYGNAIISGYYPDGVFASNYLAGAPAARYPYRTLVVSPFESQFTNITAGDYTVRADSVLKAAAPDGSDVGANFPELMAALEGVKDGFGPVPPPGDPLPVPPAVDFAADCRFLECTFTDASTAGTAPMIEAAWSFGDSAMSSGSAATHTFAAAGSYDVALTVTDLNGLTATRSKTIAVVAPVAPTAAMTVSCTNLVCNYSQASTAGSSAISSWSWTFGDGSPALSGPGGGAYVFLAGGTYTVALTVSDLNGLSAAASTTVRVAPPNVAPTAAFVASCEDLLCSFADRSTDADGTVVVWTWNFGGATASGAAASFAFAGPGTYPVTLTVADDDDAMSTVTVPVVITGRLHAAYSGTTLKWSSKTGTTQYWSADVITAIHGVNERPIPGATVTAVWSGAVVKTVTCVTDLNGRCTFKSGTLSYIRSTATLNVTRVSGPNSVYVAGSNHVDGGAPVTAFTLNRP
jgi:PKD repeat protein